MSDSTEQHIDTDELSAIAERARGRVRTSTLGLITAIIAIAAFVAVGILFLNKANASNTALDQTNCSRHYSSVLSVPVTERDDLTSEVAALVGKGQGIFDNAILGLEAGRQPSAEVIATFEANRAKLATTTAALDNAIAVVASEPTQAKATVHGFTFQGTHYPACPGE